MEKSKKDLDIAAMIDMVELERDRLVLETIDIEGESYETLSKKLKIPKATLYNIRKRAIERLKKKARAAIGDADATSEIQCEQYVLDTFGIHRALDELKTIAESKGILTKEGIALESVGKLCESFGLVRTQKRSKLTEISECLARGQQVLVIVDGGELVGNPFEERIEDILLGGIPDHCAVVMDYDEKKKEVIIFDPAFGDIPLTLSEEHFNDAWEDSGRLSVTISK